MTLLDAALAASALGLTVGGAALGLRGCVRRGARAWLVHGVTTAAMLAMAMPAGVAERVGGPTSAEWSLVLTVALAWTVADAVRGRLTASRRLGPGDAGALVAAVRGHAREAVDLAATTLLLLAMAATSASVTSPAAGGGAHAHGGGAPGDGVVPVLAGWAVALGLLATGRATRDHWELAGSGTMLAAMAVMAATHATG